MLACFGELETAGEHRKLVVRALAHANRDGKAAIEATIARAGKRGWVQGAELIPRSWATLEGDAIRS